MVQAWQRQFGVDVPFNVDRMTGTVRLRSPHRIQISTIRKGAKDAGFSLHGIRIHTTGTVTRNQGKGDGSTVVHLVLPGTNQQFELRNVDRAIHDGDRISIRGKLIGRTNGTPVIVTEELQFVN